MLQVHIDDAVAGDLAGGEGLNSSLPCSSRNHSRSRLCSSEHLPRLDWESLLSLCV